MPKIFLVFAKAFLFFALFLCGADLSSAQKEKVSMKEVSELVKLPVKKTLEGTPVTYVNKDDYITVLKTDRENAKPVISFFYSNIDPESQRLASLLRYVSQDYRDSIFFLCVETAEKGKPDKVTSVELKKVYGVDRIPGILFYDTSKDGLVLEDEDYIYSDFKHFETPSLIFWRTYYRIVSKKLDEILAD